MRQFLMFHFLCNNQIEGKGKAHPKTGHEGPEGEWRYSCTFSLTSALYGVGGQPHASAALPLGERPDTHCIGGWMVPRAGLDECGDFRPPPPPAGRCIKFFNKPINGLGCMNVILWHSNHRHVVATHVAIFRVMRA